MIRRGPILLVEDDPDHVALAVRALKKAGLPNEIKVAETGEEALAILHDDASGTLPVVVFLDLNLPAISGHDVLDHVRNHPRTRLLPVVILSSSTNERDIASSYEKKANGYISKPTSFSAFTELIKDTSRYWALHNHQPASNER